MIQNENEKAKTSIHPGGPDIMPGPYPNPSISVYDLEMDYLALETKLNAIINSAFKATPEVTAEVQRFQCKAMLFIARSMPQDVFYPFADDAPDQAETDKP